MPGTSVTALLARARVAIEAGDSAAAQFAWDEAESLGDLAVTARPSAGRAASEHRKRCGSMRLNRRGALSKPSDQREHAHHGCPRRAGSGRNSEIMLTMLRTAFLAYVRVLLCLQGSYLTFQVWKDFADSANVVVLSFTLIGTYVGLAGILTAVMIRRGRRGAVVAAIAIEALWMTGAAALGNLGRFSGGQGEFRFFAVAALSLITLVGLLLPPTRAYAGLARRRPTTRVRLLLRRDHQA